MTLTDLLPPLAAAVFLVLTVRAIARTGGPADNVAWMPPAMLALVFALFSIAPVLREGAFGFWREHTRNLWGNQIWFDLLLSLGVGWFLLLPRARAAGLKPAPWLAAIVLTGSVGLLAMLARTRWCERRLGVRADLGLDTTPDFPPPKATAS